jgi:hypothetical protein
MPEPMGRAQGVTDRAGSSRKGRYAILSFFCISSSEMPLVSG